MELVGERIIASSATSQRNQLCLIGSCLIGYRSFV